MNQKTKVEVEMATLGFKRGPLVKWLVFTILITAAFLPVLAPMFVYALGTKIHSHIVLIPFVSAYLIYLKRCELSSPCKVAWVPALVALVVACLALGSYFLWGGDLSENDAYGLRAFSYLGFLLFGGFLFLGREWMTSLAFPVGFLIFMVPLPDVVVEGIERFLQLGSAEMVDVLFTLAGIPTYRDGITFQLPGIVLEVAPQCSGIRATLVLFVTSLLASYMFLRSPWRRAILVAFVLPLAIFRNGFRILVLGWLCVHIGPHMIHSIIHTRGGSLFFALSLIPLFVLMWWLYRSERAKREG